MRVDAYGERVRLLRRRDGDTWETHAREWNTKFAPQAGAAVCECVQDPASAMFSLDEFTSALTHDSVGFEGRGPARRGRPPLQNVRGRSTVRDTDLPRMCGASQNLWLAARAEGIGVGQYAAMGP